MLTLLKNLECNTPEYIGKNDILLCGSKIFKIQPQINQMGFAEVYDCSGLYVFPGIIDQHVHITGGGGEKGFSSRISQIEINDIFSAGVTTLVGLLGADSCTRSLESLFAKAKSLQEQGMSTYIYSGSYTLPPVTFTGDIIRDLVLVDKVIGVGEIAISDHRSSHSSLEQLLKVASDVHLGGLLGEKAGILNLHLGDGEEGLEPLLQIIQNSELPIEEFVPTHVNRNRKLFNQAVEYCKSGGNIDLTSGETAGISVPDAIEELFNQNICLDKVTVSSDANGSNPNIGVNRINTLPEDIVRCVIDKKLKPETAFSFVTKNVAKILKLYPNKGVLQSGSDADLLIMDSNYRLKKLFCLGKLLKEY